MLLSTVLLVLLFLCSMQAVLPLKSKHQIPKPEAILIPLYTVTLLQDNHTELSFSALSFTHLRSQLPSYISAMQLSQAFRIDLYYSKFKLEDVLNMTQQAEREQDTRNTAAERIQTLSLLEPHFHVQAFLNDEFHVYQDFVVSVASLIAFIESHHLRFICYPVITFQCIPLLPEQLNWRMIKNKASSNQQRMLNMLKKGNTPTCWTDAIEADEVEDREL